MLFQKQESEDLASTELKQSLQEVFAKTASGKLDHHNIIFIAWSAL